MRTGRRENVSWRVAVGVAFVLGACSVQPLDLSGRSCPCVEGWVCQSDVCVPASGGDAGLDADPSDAARDGDASDAADTAPRPDVGDADGAPGDTGVADADAAADLTSCDDILADAIFCDGFEDGTTSAWDSTVEDNGVVTVTTTTSYRGSSLRGETTVARGQAAVRKDFPTVDSGELWVRGYFYVPSSFTLSSVALFYAFEDVDPYDGFAVGIGAGGTVFLYVAPDIYLEGGAAPLDTWFCLQARTVVADSGGSLQAWVDGVPVVLAADIDTRPAAAISAVNIGLERSGNMQPTAVVYADELAFGTSNLPCD